jgi:hypothetical protein
MALIKSISGIRGTIGGNTGENLTPIDVVKFTSAFVVLKSEIRNQKDINPFQILKGRLEKKGGAIYLRIKNRKSSLVATLASPEK